MLEVKIIIYYMPEIAHLVQFRVVLVRQEMQINNLLV